MEVTKEQIARGLSKFIQNDVAPNISDKATQIALEIAAAAVMTNTKLLDSFLDNAFFAMLAKTETGYNLSTLKQSAMAAMNKVGNLTITIPGIKFISPDEKILQFNGEDVKRLVETIEGS